MADGRRRDVGRKTNIYIIYEWINWEATEECDEFIALVAKATKRRSDFSLVSRARVMDRVDRSVMVPAHTNISSYAYTKKISS